MDDDDGDEPQTLARKRRLFHVHAASVFLGVLGLGIGAFTGVVFSFGVAGVLFVVAGATGLMGGRSLLRGRTTVDGFIGEDMNVDGVPTRGFQELAQYAAMVGGIVLAMFGLTLGLQDVLGALGLLE